MRLRTGAVVLATMIAVTGCGSSSSPKVDEPKTFDVSGTFTLNDSGDESSILDGTPDGIGCYGSGGYSDIDRGAQVVVKNADGKQIGLGKLGLGVPSGHDSIGEPASCEFPLTVDNVPVQKGSDIYSITVSHRGDSSFKRADADSITLSLGE